MDGDGFMTYTATDPASGGVTETITDVNTANTTGAEMGQKCVRNR